MTDGLIILLPMRADGAPSWLRLVDGDIVARSESAARAGMNGEVSAATTAMLVVPQAAVTMRRVDLPDAMPPAQARAAALRLAREASIGESDGLHVVASVDDPQTVAVIARDDIAHFIAWARHHGVEPDIVLPAGFLLPEPGEGFVSARVGDGAVIRGRGLIADADVDWLEPVIAGAPVALLDAQVIDDALISALADPPINLRCGEFAVPRKSGITAGYWKRIAIWIGFIALAALLISLTLIVKYHISAARLDAKTVEIAKPVLPAANDAVLVAEEIDRLLAAQAGGAYGFTGSVAGLMTSMQSVPGVSLSTLSLGDDGLVHATLASARADDINAVLLALQAAGYRITATSSADTSGRIVADITVKP